MSRSRHQHTHSTTTGLNPGGRIPAGYSYLDRSHSLVTPSRRTIPQSLSSSKMEVVESPSPKTSFLRHSESLSSLQDASNTESPLVSSKKTSDSASKSVAHFVSQLPPNPEFWMPSQVALYLTHVLGVTPKAIVEDVTAYVRGARMGGRQFLRLREQDLSDDGLNIKWSRLMLEAVKKLRKDCVRNRIWPLEYMEQWDNEMHRQTAPIKGQHGQSKNTLKRLRDKRAVREMITNFENISETSLSLDVEDVSAPGRLHKRDSVSSLHSLSSSGSSPQLQQTALRGQGYVREQAEKYNVERQGSDESQGKHLTREQLEDWFGDLSAGEAEAIADELDAQEGYIRKAHGHLSTSSSNSSYLSTSESSSGSEPQTPSLGVHSNFDLSPIDADVVMSIVQSSSTESELCEQEKPSEEDTGYTSLVEPLRRDTLIDDEVEDGEAQARHSRADCRVNPYRMSTYDDEEAAALGLYQGSNNTLKFDTARKIQIDPIEDFEALGAAKDSIRVRKTDSSPTTPDFRDLFSPDVVAEERTNGEDIENTEPIADIEASRPTSILRTPGTYGRSALAAALRAQNIQTSPEVDVSCKKAENESEWGVTVSRKQSRRGTAAKSELKHLVSSAVTDETRYNTAASRMSLLFNPSAPADLAAKIDADVDEGADVPDDKILVPLATLQVEVDGTKSLRNKSMVLVDRRKFEALAKRMGDLEDQLANLEAVSNADTSRSQPEQSDVESGRSKLASIFDGNQNARDSHQDADNVPEADDDGALDQRDWNFALRFGMIPSYGEYRFSRKKHSALTIKTVSDFLHRSSPASQNLALGLAAGAGFVLLSEVFGRGRR